MREESLIEALQDISDIKCAVESIAYADNNIDWEERRYEIAKDILATSHIAQQIGHYSYHEETEVKDAVRMADLLIAELKKTNETK